MRVATEIGEKRVAHSQSAKEQEGMVPLKVFVFFVLVCLSVDFLYLCLCVFVAHSQSTKEQGSMVVCVCLYGSKS